MSGLSKKPRKRAAGWRERVEAILAERDAECVRLYKAGQSVWEVGLLMDVSQEHVRTTLARAGVKPRKRGRSQKKA